MGCCVLLLRACARGGGLEGEGLGACWERRPGVLAGSLSDHFLSTRSWVCQPHPIPDSLAPTCHPPGDAEAFPAPPPLPPKHTHNDTYTHTPGVIAEARERMHTRLSALQDDISTSLTSAFALLARLTEVGRPDCLRSALASLWRGPYLPACGCTPLLLMPAWLSHALHCLPALHEVELSRCCCSQRLWADACSHGRRSVLNLSLLPLPPCSLHRWRAWSGSCS